jgi:hypothetical protein
MSRRFSLGQCAAIVLALLLNVGPAAGDDPVAGNGTLPPLHVKQGYGIKGLVLWLAADSGITTDAQGQVIKIADRTGNFTLATTAGNPGPTLVPKVLNGLPILRFDGKQSLYSPYNFGAALDHAMTFIIVAMTNGAPYEEFSLYLGKNASQGYNRAMAVLNGNELFDGQWVGCQGEPAVKQVFVMTGTSINASLTQATFYRNRKQIMTSSLLPASTATFQEVSDGVTLGAAPVQLYGWNGDIAEELVYDRQLSAAEMQNLWVALSAKYALPHSTPVSTSSAQTPSTGTSP